MDEDEALLTRVSYHAVTRYVQRVLGCPQLTPMDIDSLLCAQTHCDAIGVSIDDVRRMILVPVVQTGLRLGATRVFTGNFIAVLDGFSNQKPRHKQTPVIITILERAHDRTLQLRHASGPRLNRERRRPSRATTMREAHQL